MQDLVVVHLRDHAGKADTPALQHEDAGCDCKKADILLGDKLRKPDKRPLSSLLRTPE